MLLDERWDFICAAIKVSQSDDDLGHIAAGPVEHLLGSHFEAYIEKVEKEANANSDFARMLAGVWQYTMTDAAWRRIKALQSQVKEPLESE